MKQQIRAFGFPWYTQENYTEILKIMQDAHLLPRTYNEWLAKAIQKVQEIESEGGITLKVYIDPQTFPAWCRQRGLHIDSKARIEYANLIAYQTAGTTH